MKQLKAYGYNTITFSDLHEHYMDGSPLPKNPVIITFDDGYESNYTIGYPILKKYGLNACIFIITNAIGNYNYMNESQLKEITSSGVIDVQSHSASHSYDLPYMSGNKIDSELLDSKMRLESITGNKVNIFCYPSGRYSQRLVDKLIEHEYIFSVTTNYGLASKKNNPFLLRRIRVMGSDSGKELKAKIETLTKRITEFIGIPEETIIPEQSPEPSIEPKPDQSTESDPQTSTEPEGPGQTDEDETKPSEESIMEESDSPEPDTTAQPKPDPESDLEDEAEPKTETEPEPESDPETDTVPEPESESASEESMITDP
ncbi:MAG: polysaccharide deacetylase family protein [Clostridiaceae bacterium]|nr:polysaccharide deacetylase family protein [Clostridiaceae bacterium]